MNSDMLTVKTYLDKSSIAGIGLFAGEFIRQGKEVYRHTGRFTIIVEDDEINLMPVVAKEHFLKYSYKGIGKDRLQKAVYYNIDDSRFINHSDTPNLKWMTAFNMYAAIENIEKGTELTCNYNDFAKRNDTCFKFE